MRPPDPTRISEILSDVAEKQRECRDAGLPVYGLPPATMTLLEAAAAGQTVPPDALLRATGQAESLIDTLGWAYLADLRRRLLEERPAAGSGRSGFQQHEGGERVGRVRTGASPKRRRQAERADRL
jgi:hypothetical protein